jgi:nifR3 family TIM-barrel protein
MVSMTKEIVDTCTLPVTVKTRLGWDEASKHIVEVAERLQDVGIQAISIHGRTRAQMYKGDADWSLIAAVKDNPRMHIPVFGNGDIDSPEKALRYKDKYGVDGIMIGRAAIGAPWFFRQVKQFLATGDAGPLPDMQERVRAVRLHLQKSLEWKGERLGVVEMRRHYANYFRGLPHFKEHRLALVTMDNPSDIEAKLEEIVHHFGDHVFL